MPILKAWYTTDGMFARRPGLVDRVINFVSAKIRLHKFLAGTLQPSIPLDLKAGTFTSPTNIYVVDSSTGFGAAGTGSTPPKWLNSYPGRLRTLLEDDWGNAGTGMVLANAVVRANPTWDPRFTFAGTITDIAAGFHRTCCWGIASGSSISFTSNAKEFLVYAFTETLAGATVQIDNGTARTLQIVSGSTADIPQESGYHAGHAVFKVSAGTLGNHTVKINCTSGQVRLWAVEARTGAGKIIVHNTSVSGKSLGTMGFAASSANDETNGLFGKPLLRTLFRQGPGVLVLGLNANEWTGGTTTTVVATRVDEAIALAAQYGLKVVIDIHPQPSPTLQGGTMTYTQMIDTLKARAAAGGALVMDNSKLFASKAAGYSNTTVYTEQQLHDMGISAGLFADNIHPNNTGATLIGTTMEEFFDLEVPAVVGLPYEWSDTNLPWAYTDRSVFTEHWPTDVVYRDLQTTAPTFAANLHNTVNSAAGQRPVVRCTQTTKHVHRLNSFIPAHRPQDPVDQSYSFGFWNSNFRGWLGMGPDICHIQMDANSMTQEQLDKLASKRMALFQPSQMAMIRIDGSDASRVLLAGVTFQAADQNPFTSTDPEMANYYWPQPAPHNGVFLFPQTSATISYVRFRGAGRAINSRPPFEHANIGSQFGSLEYYHCEFDGRRSPDIDPARPRRCGVIMTNNEDSHYMEDCWIHHSNVSRYAANDGNRETVGTYTLLRVKADNITNNRNSDPAINGGNSLGGFTHATPFGWESVGGTITATNCIVQQDNPYNEPQFGTPQHFQLTSPADSTGTGRNPKGGRFYVNGGEYRNAGYPQLNGFVCFRIQQITYWAVDGYNNTLFVYHKNGQRLLPYYWGGAWPPSAAQLATAGVTPTTHYIIDNA